MAFQSRQRWILGWAVMVMALLPAAGTMAGGVRTLVAVGEASIRNNDPVEARQRAIGRACFAAVDRVVADLMAAEAIVEHFPTINEVVFNHPDAFIQNYKVRTEWRDAERYRVLIECLVGGDTLKDRLAGAGLVPVSPALRSVLFMMVERTFPRDPPQFWWGPDYLFARAASEMAMGEILEENGFSIIDHDDPRNETAKKLPSVSGPEPSIEEIARVGAFFAADVVVVGHAGAEMAANPVKSRPRAFEGRVRLQAVSVHNGQVLVEIEELSVAVATDEITGGQNAIAAAARQAGEILAQRLGADRKPTQEETGAGTVSVLVKGIQPMAHFVRFRQALGSLPGVEAVQTREMTATEAILQLQLNGSIRDLADAMRHHPFEGLRVEVSDVGRDRIDLQLIDSGHLP